MSQETEAFIKDLEAKHGGIEVVSSGSSLKFCLVAEGKADYYPRYAPTMEWETRLHRARVTLSEWLANHRERKVNL